MSQSLAGFWRRIRITAAAAAVQAELEDDFHCMSVVVYHNGETATGLAADIRRAPWSTCPGAENRLEEAFTGIALRAFAECGGKKSHCTHLFDLAVLAATHADDEIQTIYDIRITDPVEQQRHATISCNGETLLSWREKKFHLLEPETAKGIRLDQLRSWIATLAPELHEAARLLQWGNILANGRVIPMDQQSDASKMPPACYTFQPERAVVAQRVGAIKDFSESVEQPLQDYETVV
ncbi:MAG: DUF2889 domain-containing protein [Pseudomonadales bacterium]|nr:DUF2889 domain-containing protein [Pseudomonadales bacterium]